MECGRSKPVVFLDRDGVLSVEKSYVCSVDELEIFPYAKECVRTIHEKGYLAIVVTNQSGVARGYFTEEQLQEMNRYLMRETGVDAVYYCPHHEKALSASIPANASAGSRQPEWYGRHAGILALTRRILKIHTWLATGQATYSLDKMPDLPRCSWNPGMG